MVKLSLSECIFKYGDLTQYYTMGIFNTIFGKKIISVTELKDADALNNKAHIRQISL